MIKAELHAHTADDPLDRIPYTSTELVDRAAALGYQALAITLHERQLDVRRLEAYAADRGVMLIRGIEQSVAGKHVLLLNFTRAAENVRTFDDLSRLRQREPEGVAIAPHPFFPGQTCLARHLEEHATLFDAVEWNAMFTRHINFNVAAAEWARRHGKPIVGNGDIHRLHQLGTTFSLIEADMDPHAVCAAVREGRLTVQTTPLSLARAVSTMADLLWEDARRASGVNSSRKAEERPCPRRGAAAPLSDLPSSLLP